MNNISSPRTDDEGVEAEIKAKGKTAPRVTQADIEANIVTEVYFTALHGAISSGNLTEVHGNEPDIAFTAQALGLMTFCVLVLRNGFTVTGESACASPENFDAEIGRKVARANAIQKIWPLLGHQLKSALHLCKETP